MEDREQEHRLRRAAWGIAYWGRLYVLFMIWFFVTMNFQIPPGWWLPFLTEMAARRVRKGEGLKGALAVLLIFQFYAIGGLWLVADGELGTGGPQTRARLLSFAAAQVVLIGVALVFTWRAWVHAPRSPRPERTPAQIARHRQYAGIVLLVGGLAAAALTVVSIDHWQETGRTSHALKGLVGAVLLAWLLWLLSRAVARGSAVIVVTAILLPALIMAPTGAVVTLIVLPFGSRPWLLALAYGLCASVALVIAMRGILAGERKGQGDAG